MPTTSVWDRLEPLLPRVRKPVQYVGGERNATVKPWEDAEVHWALCYPDAYEVGLPNQGLMILYEVLNERPDALAERTYAVWPDLAALMREHGVPQFTVDGHRPVAAFDVLGISFATELGYTNMLEILDLAGIPLRAADRTLDHPFVLAGGHAAFNPEPIADFVDLVALGDGEEVVGDITEVVKAAKAEGLDRWTTLERLAGVPGVYVPALYTVDYREDGAIAAVRPLSPAAPARIHKRTTSDLDDWAYPKKPLVPMAETVHERMSVEIFRGCTRGCRFCQAGMITRPVRERVEAGHLGDDRDRSRGLRATPRSGCSRSPAPTTPRSATSPRASPTATRAPARASRCRRPASTRSTSTSPRSSPAPGAGRASRSPPRAAPSGCGA